MTKANDFARWTTPSNNLPVLYDPQPQKGAIAMRDAPITKRLAVKFVGSTRPTETVIITPGTTTRELLKELNLGPGFEISDALNEVLYRPDEVIFARVADGDLLHISAMVDAGA